MFTSRILIPLAKFQKYFLHKVWIFDHPDGGGRLLRQRSGHSAPPTYVRYHGNDGKNILSAGM